MAVTLADILFGGPSVIRQAGAPGVDGTLEDCLQAQASRGLL